MRAMRACFGLTQGDLESEYNKPFLSSLSFNFSFLFSNLLASDLRMCSDRYHEVFVQKIPIFCDTAMSSIAVAHRRYCQEDPYFSVKSVSSWRTRDDFFKKIPVYDYAINDLLAHTMY